MPLATLVLSGGGTKGAFQAGAEEVLRTAGYTWERVYGVSVGALNGAMIAQAAYDELLKVWTTLKEEHVYDKVGWLRVAWRLAVRKKTGLYDQRPLRELIRRHVEGRPFRIPLHVGRVSLTSGSYELVDHTSPDIFDAIWHSASMPVIWEAIGPRALVDGGIRNVTPLGDALATNPAELIVLICSPEAIEPASSPPDVLAAAKRSLTDITINEILVNDVEEFVRINALVKQAEAVGLTLRDEAGHPFRYCKISVLRPRLPLGDTLDFAPSTIRHRLEVGRETAAAWLSTHASSPG